MADDEKGEDKFSIRRIRDIIKKDEKVEPIEVEPEKEPVVAEPVEAEPVETEPVEAEVLEETKQVESPPVSPPPEEKKGFFSQFPKLYWVADILELFERGAYYGVLAVLSVHIIQNLKVGYVTTGLLLSMFLFFSYFWPLLAGAFARKYGFRKVLLASFFMLMGGYFITSTIQTGQMGLLIISLVLIGFGAGTFKPLISATIAFVTVEKQRNLAYSLYYWFINFGAFIFPLILGFVFPSPETWRFIFIVSAVLISINVVIGFTMYTNPVEPDPDISIGKAFQKVVIALKDKKFNRLLLIYSGFWFMYAVNHSFLPLYMLGFHRMPQPEFTPQFLAVINPLVIIIVGPFLGKLVEKYKSLNVMMVGMFIYCAGVLITFTSNSEVLFVTGIAVFSLGEFVTHPGFISYVSKIAPKDKVEIYMGAIFLSTGIGITTGPAIMGVWYDTFVVSWHQPKLFGAAITAVGFLTIALLILYNRWVNKINKEEDPSFEQDTSLWTKTTTSMVVLLLIPTIIGVGLVGGTDIYYGLDIEDDAGPKLPDWENDYDLMSGEPITKSGYLIEGDNIIQDVTVDEDIVNVAIVTFVLTWTDESDASGIGQLENQPDSFSMSVEGPDGRTSETASGSNSQGAEGTISIIVSYSPDKDPYLNGTGRYNITIECTEAGDHEPQINIIGARVVADTGNDWDLSVVYDYLVEKEE
jgi:MFS family permease